MEQQKKKGIRQKMDKLLLGIIVGGAVGSILAPKSGKETRQAIRKKTGEVRQKISNTKEEKTKKHCSENNKKKGFWYVLNRIFCHQRK